MLFLLFLATVFSECVNINNNTYDLGEYQQFVTYDYSYPNNSTLSARQALASQRVNDKYLIKKFAPSYIAATLYPKCNRQTNEVFPDICLLDRKFAYCCGVYFAPGYDFALQLPRCTPLVYDGKGLYSLFAGSSVITISTTFLIILMFF